MVASNGNTTARASAAISIELVACAQDSACTPTMSSSHGLCLINGLHALKFKDPSPRHQLRSHLQALNPLELLDMLGTTLYSSILDLLLSRTAPHTQYCTVNLCRILLGSKLETVISRCLLLPHRSPSPTLSSSKSQQDLRHALRTTSPQIPPFGANEATL